jgi:hypothetical protein
MSSHKTDNSSLATKVLFRLARLPEKEEIKVLDCYHGSGACWFNIKLNTDKKIIVHGMDIEDKDSFVLLGDNRKVLRNITLSNYDVIDVDAYGVPYEIIKQIFEYQDNIDVIVFYTFCQTYMGSLPKDMMIDLGYTSGMYEKAPTLINKKGHNKFLQWLALNGVEKVEYIKLHGNNTRVYGCFKLKCIK